MMKQNQYANKNAKFLQNTPETIPESSMEHNVSTSF
jgi:hypothetical protein